MLKRKQMVNEMVIFYAMCSRDSVVKPIVRLIISAAATFRVFSSIRKHTRLFSTDPDESLRRS
jgi:hypothetical protein